MRSAIVGTLLAASKGLRPSPPNPLSQKQERGNLAVTLERLSLCNGHPSPIPLRAVWLGGSPYGSVLEAGDGGLIAFPEVSHQ